MSTDHIEEFPLQKLKEYHEKHGFKMEAPKYDIRNSNTQILTFTATCTYQNYTSVGSANSKIAAKRQAAINMLQNLNLLKNNKNSSLHLENNSSRMQIDELFSKNNKNSSLHLENNSSRMQTDEPFSNDDVFITKNKDKIASFIEKYQEDPNSSLNVRIDVPLEDVNLGFKKSDSPKSESLHCVKNQNLDAIDYFIKVMIEMKLQFSINIPSIKSQYENKVFVAFLKIHFNLLVVGGTGNSIEQAVWQACENAVDMLRTYTM